MKKFFECIGILSLACISFFFTEKTVDVVKESDSILVEIKNADKKHYEESVDAIISDNIIIPGIYGTAIDVDKSYENMKRVGIYQESLLVYKRISPKISLEKKYDKYIVSGNPKKNMVTLLFLVENNSNTSKIEKILEQKDVKASFFIDGIWFENNNDKVFELVKKDYTIGNLSYNRDYTNSSFIWMDTIIRKVGNQRVSFCYNEAEDNEALKICARNKNYTVRPNIIVNQYPLSEIKEKLSAGSIISLPINSAVEKELPLIIEYIKAKGYSIENLYNHLEETY